MCSFMCTQCWLVPWTTINPKFYLNQSVHVHVKTWLFTLAWHSSFYLNQSIFMSKSSCLPSNDIYRCDTGDHVEYISCIYWHIYIYIWLNIGSIYRHRCMQIQKWNMQHVRQWHWHCSTQFQGWTVNFIPIKLKRKSLQLQHTLHHLQTAHIAGARSV